MGDKADGGELTRVNSYQWPSGHVAHLSEGQLAALEKFKKLTEKKGYYDPGDDNAPPSHDEETLLRYLRARKFIPQEAFTQFQDTEDWRKQNDLDRLYETIDINEYEQTRRLYPQWTGRRDKRGIPFYVFEIGDLNPKDVSVYTNSKDSRKQSTNSKTPWKMLKLFALYENLCRFVLPMCSAVPDRPHHETPISQSNNIVDLTGVGFGKLFNLRNHMSDASKLATAHYPETLDRIFVVGAPSYFETVWGWAKSWFDPITVSKIFILSSKTQLAILEKYVDLDNIPKKYGGNLDWKFGDMPNLDPGIADSLQWKGEFVQNGHRTLPIGPIKWQYDASGDLVATAIGTEDGKPRERVVAGLHPQAGVARLALSPGRVEHVRSKKVGQASPTQAVASANVDSASTGNKKTATPTTNGPVMSSDPNLNVGKDPDSHVAHSSRTGTYTVPYKDSMPAEQRQALQGEASAPGSSAPPAVRAGTSESRALQQGQTHAGGTLVDGTPEYNVDSQGAKAAVMDPNTVGQAPKEHPLPIPEAPQPSMVDQAKDYAGQAVETARQLPNTVMSAVGMGEKKDEEHPVQEEKKEDPAVDAMPGKNVEEFLRSQTMSKPETEV